MNVFSGVGRIGRDAEVRSTQGGTSVAGFPLAVDVGYGDNKSTLWLDCSLWGKRAEGGLVQYLRKGQQVSVSGEIATRQYPKNDGTQGFAVTLKLNEVGLVGGQPQQSAPPQQSAGNAYRDARQGNAPQPQQNYGSPDPGDYDDFNDRIPF